MKLFEKKPFNSKNGIETGYILELKDKVGLESDSKEFGALVQAIARLKIDFKSAIILVSTIDLIRWDTYGLRAIIPTLIDVNKELKAMGRPPICIIGDTTRDLYHAVEERWADSAKAVPWFNSIEDFRNTYKV